MGGVVEQVSLIINISMNSKGQIRVLKLISREWMLGSL